MKEFMADAFDQRVAAVRRFSRFYTRRIGLLQDGLLDSPFSLTEGRVLYEIAQQNLTTASDLVSALGIDHGYLSRILRRFQEKGLIDRRRAKDDGRQMLLALTAKGRRAFVTLDRRSQHDMGAMLHHLSDADQRNVVAAMSMIERLTAGPSDAPRRGAPYTLRGHRAGDMGWVVARHGLLYEKEYGWGPKLEAITAEIVSNFLNNLDPARERCWITEIDGEPVGCVFLVRESDEVARIRLVEPRARGLGIGHDLVQHCINFARAANYRKITLWTHTVLIAARGIYERAGFQLVRQWIHDDFGKPESSETWELKL
jgi:DNA-binding MarR family transcriptional regulator/GNAT superfamily N-acetyltransferase